MQRIREEREAFGPVANLRQLGPRTSLNTSTTPSSKKGDLEAPRTNFGRYKTIISLFTIASIIIFFFFGLISLKNSTIDHDELEFRQDFVRNMTREAWYAYRKWSWGAGALDPIHGSPSMSGINTGMTIVSALSTLHVLGLEKEFSQGVHWIEQNGNWSRNSGDSHVSKHFTVSQAISDFIGGLLSVFALTGDVLFQEKAREMTRLLEPAFATPTGLLMDEYISIFDHSDYSNKYCKSVNLASIGHCPPELIYLADLTKNRPLKGHLQKIRDVLRSVKRPQGLFLDQINIETGNWSSNRTTFSGSSVQFYYDLVRSNILSDGRDTEALRLFERAILAAINNRLFRVSSPSRYSYSSDYDVKSNTHYSDMSAASCSLGAMLSLGAHMLERRYGPMAERYWALAFNLTETCHKAASKTETKLLPEVFRFNQREEASNLDIVKSSLSPELAESYFILWRLTQDPKYREYAWQLAQAIHGHCRTEKYGGYSTVTDVDMIPATVEDHQPPRFLSGTLKYLYLTFADEDVLPLDRWVFNAAGHPLPVCGVNRMYTRDACD